GRGCPRRRPACLAVSLLLLAGEHIFRLSPDGNRWNERGRRGGRTSMKFMAKHPNGAAYELTREELQEPGLMERLQSLGVYLVLGARSFVAWVFSLGNHDA